jgi:hypothetical protein
LLAGGTDCTLQVYNIKKVKPGDSLISPEFILRQFKDEILFVSEVCNIIYIIDIKMMLYTFPSNAITCYNEKTAMD